MQALIDVILPVFLVMGAGYAAVWRGLLGQDKIEGLMAFSQTFGIPCLLFRAIATLDLGQEFDLALLFSFYTGALAGFAAGLLGARYLFARSWEDAVTIGFVCLFSNSLMLGLPITERAYGTAALAANYAIIAIHSPLCYIVGITAMEIVRSTGKGPLPVLRSIAATLFRNALVLAILAGFVVNLSGIVLPGAAMGALDMIVRSAIPVALFALGGVLFRYRPEGDMRTILYVCAISLVLHPAVVWGMGLLTGLTQGQMRSAVLTGAMAPGINAYIFANFYGSAKRVAASSVLIGTGLMFLTAWGWLALLG